MQSSIKQQQQKISLSSHSHFLVSNFVLHNPFERGSDFIHDSLLTRKLFHINVIDSNGFSDKRANKSLAVLVA